MAKRVKYSAELFDDLFIDAMGGDSVAIDQYKDYARKLAKQVNQQLLETERKGIESESYRLASVFLGDKKRFKENVSNLSIDELRSEVDALLSVRNTKDYSIPYAVKANAEIRSLKSAITKGGFVVNDATAQYHLNEILKSGAWEEYKKSYNGTGPLFSSLVDAVNKGQTINDFMAAYNQYADKDNKTDRLDLAQSWTVFAGRW